MKKWIALWLTVLLFTGCTGGIPEEDDTEGLPQGETTGLPETETEPAGTGETAAEGQDGGDTGTAETMEGRMQPVHLVNQGPDCLYATCGDTFVLLRFDRDTLLYNAYGRREEPITDQGWAMVSPTSDGRVLLWGPEDPARYTIWLDGEVTRSGEYDQILWFCGDWVLAAEEGMLGMYNPDGDLVQTLCEWTADMAFVESESGWRDAYRDLYGIEQAAGVYVVFHSSEGEKIFVVNDTGTVEKEGAVPGEEPWWDTPCTTGAGAAEKTWYLYGNRDNSHTVIREEKDPPLSEEYRFLGTYETWGEDAWLTSISGTCQIVLRDFGEWTLYDPITGESTPLIMPEGTVSAYGETDPAGEIIGWIVVGEDGLFAWYTEEDGLLTDYRFTGISCEGGGRYLTASESVPEDEGSYPIRTWIIDRFTGEGQATGWGGISVLTDGEAVFFKCSDWYETSYDIMVLREDMTPLREERFFQAELLSDGRLLGIPVIEEDDTARSRFFEIYDGEGNLTFTSREYDRVLCLAGEYVAVNDGGRLCLADSSGSIVVNFAPWTEDMFVHFLLSGRSDGKALQDPAVISDPYLYHYYEQSAEDSYVPAETDRYPAGIYILTEDESVENGTVGRAKEYFWCPDTGLVGMLAFGEVGGYAKPVLYLYPKEETQITVIFAHPEYLTTVYPAYDEGWQVTASPDGTLTDDRGREYYALYWEESGYVPVDFSTGFCVAGEDAAAFLEEKLARLGLTDREANEMILYWLPVLEKNGHSLVYFELTESREAYNRLQITPAPDSLLRIAIHIRKTDGYVRIEEQKLPRWERAGFSAVEWGGVIHE